MDSSADGDGLGEAAAPPMLPADDPLDARLGRIADQLAALRVADAARRLLGAATHDYRLESVLSPAELAALEAQLEVHLPDEQRRFVTRLGRAGAGPGFGLLLPAPLAVEGWPRVRSLVELEGCVVESETPRRPGFGQLSSTTRPFLLDGPWRPRFAYDRPRLPAGATPYDGCIRLADESSGFGWLLVVQGARRGEVWHDTMAAVRGGALRPTGLGLLDWYERWLEGGLAGAG